MTSTRPTQWNNATVASFTYRDERAHTTVTDVARPVQRWTKKSSPILTGGATFDDAVAAAKRYQGKDPLNHAYGVLRDAKSGVHWLAPLGGDTVPKHSIDGYLQRDYTMYGPRRWAFRSVEATTPDLQAVVGFEKVIDFRTK